MNTRSEHAPIVHMENIEKHFGNVIALAGVSFDITPGECHCLLGDNGAGKSTFIKTMSGVHKPTKGRIMFEGQEMNFNSPRDSMEAGIATVYQDLAMIPLELSRRWRICSIRYGLSLSTESPVHSETFLRPSASREHSRQSSTGNRSGSIWLYRKGYG